MSLALYAAIGAAPAPRRKGRPVVSSDQAERQKHIECAGLMLKTRWPVKRVADSCGISRRTAYYWLARALTYDEPEAVALRRHKR
jgi:hypothetical protein